MKIEIVLQFTFALVLVKAFPNILQRTKKRHGSIFEKLSLFRNPASNYCLTLRAGQLNEVLSFKSSTPFFVDQIITNTSMPSWLDIPPENGKNLNSINIVDRKNNFSIKKTAKIEIKQQRSTRQITNFAIESSSEISPAAEIATSEFDMKKMKVESSASDEQQEDFPNLRDEPHFFSSTTTDKFSKFVLLELLRPLISPEIEENVPEITIKGAAIAGASISLLGGKSIAFSGVSAASAIYLAITPGKVGESMRLIGNAVWKTGSEAVDVLRKSKIDRVLSAILVAVGLNIREMSREKYDIDLPILELPDIELVTEAKDVEKKEIQQSLEFGLPNVRKKKKTGEDLEQLSTGVARKITNRTNKDWSLLTIVGLKAELKSRGLEPLGKKKADLVAALEESDRKDVSAGVTRIKTNEPDKDWSLLTVIGLKLELKSRGLKSSGKKKVELIAALEESDRKLDKTRKSLQYQASIESRLDSKISRDNKSFIENIESMTVVQLKNELRRKGLKVGGRKADLIQRLLL